MPNSSSVAALSTSSTMLVWSPPLVARSPASRAARIIRPIARSALGRAAAGCGQDECGRSGPPPARLPAGASRPVRIGLRTGFWQAEGAGDREHLVQLQERQGGAVHLGWLLSPAGEDHQPVATVVMGTLHGQPPALRRV